MEDGSHDGDVEGTAGEAPVGVVEAGSLSSAPTPAHARKRRNAQLLAKGIRLGILGHLDVVGKDLSELRLGESHLLGELSASLEALHEATTAVVLHAKGTSASCSQTRRPPKEARTNLAMPLNLLARLSVEDEADRVLAVLPHLARNVIAVTELVGEPVALVVEEESSDSTERFGGEELDLGVGVLGVDETWRRGGRSASIEPGDGATNQWGAPGPCRGRFPFLQCR